MDADEQEEAGELQGGLWQYKEGPAEAREKHALARKGWQAHLGKGTEKFQPLRICSFEKVFGPMFYCHYGLAQRVAVSALPWKVWACGLS